MVPLAVTLWVLCWFYGDTGRRSVLNFPAKALSGQAKIRLAGNAFAGSSSHAVKN
ncbi:hypothetical protein FHR33_008355 [Nonomuraea dietziae]|uniref:Uncharacterized protein n=1 Tax=Nonomuraea dietziae TaxID=65515 RepID=A0A7W5VI37_9ACTN|nr:hypothetical protein [Nonomuraea dietziae]